VTTTLTLTPLNDRGTEILDRLDAALLDTGARSYSINTRREGRRMATRPRSTG
jgi:hypothetical protein